MKSTRIGFFLRFCWVVGFTLAGLSAFAVETATLPNGDLFVRWKAGTPASVKIEAYRKASLKPVWRSSLVSGLERVVHTQGQFIEENSAPLKGHPNVLYAEPNYRVTRKLKIPRHGIRPNQDSEAIRAGAPGDPMYSQQWALQPSVGLKIEQAWDVTQGASSIKVAVIDTGVDFTHEDLQGKGAAGYDFIDRTAKVTDHHGHGTHVSGVIGANVNNGKGIAGINQKVTIIPIRAVPSNGDETDANVIEAFEFAVQQGARVANCSFGKAKSTQAVSDVITAAGTHGLLAVVSAGNDDVDLNKTPTYPASFHNANMIVIAATTSSGGRASFSNYGIGKVDIGAPGEGILSTIPGNQYDSWDGTSMASPQVTGTAALILAVNPALTPVQVKDILMRSAEKDSKLTSTITTGARLDAAAAVKLASQSKR